MTARDLVAVTFFPATLAAGIAVTVWLHRLGTHDTLIVFATSLVATIAILYLQAKMPYEPRWRGLPADFRNDLLHLLVSNVLTASLVRALAFGAVTLAAGWIELRVGRPLWPDHWPVLAQLALGLLVGDFFSYWTHRTLHTVPFLWRIHTLHHSTERMYTLAALRTHPINAALTIVALTWPMILLGAGPEVLTVLAVFNSLLGLMQHSNVDLRTGPLGWVLSTPELHRWHHSVDPAEGNHNFGTDTAVWDVLFGTRYKPADRKPSVVGLSDVQVPLYFPAQLAVPFTPERFRVIGR